MRTLRIRFLWLLTGIGISLFFSPAYAINGDTRIITCANCQTPTDFRDAAISDNNLNYQADATYTVVSASAGMSAIVHVSGYWFLDPYTYNEYWTVDNATMVDASGATLSTDIPTAQAQMAVIDVGLFGYSRDSDSPPVSSINMPLAYDGSFIGSTDEFDSPGIGFALGQLGINPAEFPIGAKLLVKYADGTKAVFIKISNTSEYQWTWDGIHAWDANGHPIDRAGNLIANSNTSGSASGSSSFSTTVENTGADATALWFIYQQEQCEITTTVTINGQVDSYFYDFVPC